MFNRRITTRTFYDFSDKPVFLWKIQSILFKNISFYYDTKQKVYCRKVENVKGFIENDSFMPIHWLIKYRQKIIAE